MNKKIEQISQNAPSSATIDPKYQPTSKGGWTYAKTIRTQQQKDPTSTEGGAPSKITKIHGRGISKGGGGGISKFGGDNQQLYQGTTGASVQH